MKFCGKIGFAVTKDDGYGVWTPTVVEQTYYGDVLRLIRNKDSGEHINDGLRLNSQFSIIMDPWFQENFASVKYIEYMGAKWAVESADPTNYPRVLLTPGGLYHGDEPEEESEDSASGDTGEDSGE